MFDPVDPKVSFPEQETRVLALWKDEDVPRRSFEKGDQAYVFFEGPPTANGKPGIHHVSARAFKDLYPRYKTMRGYRVDRRGGWDTHGLPVEVEVEKEIGSTGKQDIERYGVARFNQRCRDSVFRYIQDWRELTERIGFWVDLDRAYVTYDNDYIETCWWILKELWDRGLLYEDFKVTMHCPRCNSTLADHEVSQGMREEVDDPSVWPKFPAVREDLWSRGILERTETRPVFFLPWTTTPWTLAANTALAVRGDAGYALVAAPAREGEGGDGALYLMAEERLAATFRADEHRVLRRFAGAAFEGARYEPLLEGRVPPQEDLTSGHRVIVDDAVELGEGTGVLHVAPAYGDLALGQKHGLPTVFSVDLDGKVFPEVRLRGGDPAPYAGIFFKDADKLIQRDLGRSGLLYRAERVRHAYPFCWRDDSPLLFYAKTSWYIRTTAVKDKLLSNNAKINWVPGHVGSGRFGRWLENNVDWAITRERYWGCPFPVWQAEDATARLCVGSLAELSALAGRDLSGLDLHRPHVDDVAFEHDGRRYRRLPYTVDVWFESGAMPYAQWHYPFSGEGSLENRFPADFICEAQDQTRGWFYSLHALATLLTDGGDPREGRSPGPLHPAFGEVPAYRNCVVLGFINDKSGQKMSKSRGNVVDPWTVIDAHGADALRWYLYSSGSPELNKSFDTAQVVDALRRFFLRLWNSYSFFVLYANIDRPDLETPLPVEEWAESDRWLLARVNALVREVGERLDAYDSTAATRLVETFVVDDLSQWYVRINRRRFWKSGSDQDKQSAYQALYRALVAVAHLIAPMAPFVAEAMYQNLVRRRDPEAPVSVHLAPWPEADESLVDRALLRDMDLVLHLLDLGRSARASAGLKVRQPVQELVVRVTTAEEMEVVRRLVALLLRELNVKALHLLEPGRDFVSHRVRPRSRVLGPRLGKEFPALSAFLAAQRDVREIVENVRRGRTTHLEFGDRTLEVEPEGLEVEVSGPAGYAAVEDGDYLVALSTTLTDELRAEGRVREVTRLIQNARKNAGFDVTDRVRIGLRVGPGLEAAVGHHAEYVRQETLGEELRFEALADAEHAEEVEVDGATVGISLRRV